MISRFGPLLDPLVLNDNGPVAHPLLRNTATMRGRAIEVELTDPNHHH